MGHSLVYMDKKTRVAQILAKRGEHAAKNNPDAIYPPLQRPDPDASRFRSLHFCHFDVKSTSWRGVDGQSPEYTPERGWFNVGSSAKLRLEGDTPEILPDIIRVPHGLCCSRKATEVIKALDPEGVTVKSVKLVGDGGARVEPYALVGVRRRMDIVNWAQAPVRLTYLNFTRSWLASARGRYGAKPDIDPSIHIVRDIDQMFSLELIEALRESGARGIYFVNEADDQTSHRL